MGPSPDGGGGRGTPAPRDPATMRARAASFGRTGAEYHRLRPGYPDAAVDWMLPPGASDVLDLGAGTGRLADSLVARGLRVTAVDPSESMLSVLRDRHPSVRCVLGTAERLDVDDASLDAIVIGQAWHWMEPASTSAEAARVLRPGGTIAMVWNDRVATGDWRDDFHEVQHAARGIDLVDQEEAEPAAPFGVVERLELSWSRAVPRDDFGALYFTQSPWLIADEATRAERLRRWANLLADHPEPTIVECYRTTAWRARLVA